MRAALIPVAAGHRLTLSTVLPAHPVAAGGTVGMTLDFAGADLSCTAFRAGLEFLEDGELQAVAAESHGRGGRTLSAGVSLVVPAASTPSFRSDVVEYAWRVRLAFQVAKGRNLERAVAPPPHVDAGGGISCIVHEVPPAALLETMELVVPVVVAQRRVVRGALHLERTANLVALD